MDTELRAMLQFFHSLGSLLWFDTPSLRSLVIIDLQWLVDAVGRKSESARANEPGARHARVSLLKACARGHNDKGEDKSALPLEI